MPIPSVFATRFFQLITARRFAEAERVLQRLRLRVPTTEWNRGYFQALDGMLLAQKHNNDRYAFLSNMSLSDKEELQSHRREFLKQARSRVHADYDRGYFAAWASYMRILAKLLFDDDKMEIKRRGKRKVKAQAEADRKVREASDKKIKADAAKSEIRKVERAERIEPHQSTLFDFSKQ